MVAEGGKKLLPLDAKELKSIAVVGPYANEVLLDWYSGTPPFAVTPVEGIRARVGAGVTVTYDKGDDLAAVTALAKTVDAVVVVIGNHPTCGAGWKKCPTAERWERGYRSQEPDAGAGGDCEGGACWESEDGGGAAGKLSVYDELDRGACAGDSGDDA